MKFEAFPKIPRLTRACCVTEKLDGTNAHVHILPASAYKCEDNREGFDFANVVASNEEFVMLAGSRSRFITPGKSTDNYGFAAWVKEHADELFTLGPGRHFGEWWGQGIQRNYGLTEKRFSLFNANRWLRAYEARLAGHADAGIPACCHVVPVLYRGLFDTTMIDWTITDLAENGSKAAPGFMNPEGIVVWHDAAQSLFKKTFDDDGKFAQAHS